MEGSWCETVAADLVARKTSLVEQQRGDAVPAQQSGSATAAGAGSHDNDVEGLLHALPYALPDTSNTTGIRICSSPSTRIHPL